MKSTYLFTFFLLLAPAGFAQTNPPPERATYITNWVAASADFRRVGGQLYNIKRSQLWKDLNLKFVRMESNTVIARQFTMEPIYESHYRPSTLSSQQQRGAYSPGGQGGGYRQVEVGQRKIMGELLALKNNRHGILTTGQEFETRAIRLGTYPADGETLEYWDNGETNWAPVVTLTKTAGK